MTRKHSKIGASSAERWFACPGSVKACEGLTAVESEYARTGTAAHALASQCLEMGFNAERFLNWGVDPLGMLVHLDDPVSKVPVTQEMATAVRVYLDEVRKIATANIARELSVEVKFHLDQLHPDLFGTADAVVYDPKSHDLWVLDYKHGEGVLVDPEDNPQLLYYAVGAAFAKANRKVDQVHLAIIQPRAGDGEPKWWHVDAIDLLDFAGRLKEAAKATEHENAPLVAGDHCRWCPAAAVCVKLKEVVEVAPLDQFAQGKAYNVDFLKDSSDRIKALKGWIKAVEDFALAEMQKGVAIPGYKLVEKRAVRQWRDPDEAVRTLLGDGRLENEIMEPATLRSPAQIEDVLGKKDFAELMAEHVVSASSGVTYAPESDKRPAVNRNVLDGFSAV